MWKRLARFHPTGAIWRTGKQRSRQNAGSNRHCRRWDTCIRPCTVSVCLSVPRCIGATVNVFIRNTWDWVLVDFRKSDADYILRRCKNCKECVLALQKRGKKWFLDFVFQTSAKLPDVPIKDTSILAVDLGLSSACTCSIMTRSARSSERNFFPFRENATPWNMR